ncbi:MAG: RCC1 domain-containing protein, partial [Caldilineaceae bacterium]
MPSPRLLSRSISLLFCLALLLTPTNAAPPLAFAQGPAPATDAVAFPGEAAPPTTFQIADSSVPALAVASSADAQQGWDEATPDHVRLSSQPSLPSQATPAVYLPLVAGRLIKLLASVQQVGTGEAHTCVLTSGGGVKCWGFNWWGQVGDGGGVYNLMPVDVIGLESGVQAISAGTAHNCALTTSGGVKCWGNNVFGQLGDGTTSSHRIPNDVTGLVSGVQAIAAGNVHTCALTIAGGVKCWGFNASGQLGDGTTTDRDTPVDVSGLADDIRAISAGYNHTCVLTNGGGVQCWGRNIFGELGDGTTTDSRTPVDVSGLTSGVQAIVAAYDYSCALTNAGGVKCWGLNESGRLGDGTQTNRLTPVDVSGLASGVQAIAAHDQACALLSGGGVKCWGPNANGQVGDGTTTNRLTP